MKLAAEFCSVLYITVKNELESCEQLSGFT